MWHAVEVGGATLVAAGLWMLAPWAAVTFVGVLMLAVGMAKCLPRNRTE